MAPYRDEALWAAGYELGPTGFRWGGDEEWVNGFRVLRTRRGGVGNGNGLGRQEFELVALDEDVQRVAGAGFALAVGAVAGVHVEVG